MSLAIVVLGAAAVGVLLASARISSDGPTAADIEQVADEIDACLREAAAGARSRAQTLAALPRLALAVATDVATVRDLTADELSFRPGPNETIEVAQVPRSGGAPLSLLRLPAVSPVAVPLDSPGVHLVGSGTSIRVAAVVTVEPRERARELYGVVAVSWVPALERVKALLPPLGGGVRLETPTGAIEIGGPMAAGATVTVPLARHAGKGVRLIAPSPRSDGWSAGPLSVAIGVGLGALFAAGALWGRATARTARA